MRRFVTLLLALVCFASVFQRPLMAEFRLSPTRSSSVEIQNIYKNAVPFDVEVIDRGSRYAVDVEYSDMTIQVESAIWNVNTYQYDVIIEGQATNEGDLMVTTDEENPVSDPSVWVTVYNHSDRAIYAELNAELDEHLKASVTCTAEVHNNRFVVPAVVPIPNGQTQATNVTTTFVISPKEGSWQTYINRIIAREDFNQRDYVAGTITVLVTSE